MFLMATWEMKHVLTDWVAERDSGYDDVKNREGHKRICMLI